MKWTSVIHKLAQRLCGCPSDTRMRKHEPAIQGPELVALRGECERLQGQLQQAQARIERLKAVDTDGGESKPVSKRRKQQSPEELRHLANRLRSQAEILERDRSLREQAARSRQSGNAARVESATLPPGQIASLPGPAYVPEPRRTSEWLQWPSPTVTARWSS